MGCATANPFYQFYQDQTGDTYTSNAPNFIFLAGEPRIYSGSNLYADGQKMQEDGYSLLGVSSFNAGSVSRPQLIEQAKRVKAAVAIFYSRYTNTITGSIPLTLPNTTTVTTNSSGTGFNSGSIYGVGGPMSYSGMGSYFGSSTSTVNGTTTTYYPYAKNRYDYLATFWIKLKKPVFGAFMNDLSPDLREMIGSNKGVIITIVTKDSPAFIADLLKDDVIKKIDNVEVINIGTMRGLLPKLAGQTVSVELLRKGKSITKQVKLNTPE